MKIKVEKQIISRMYPLLFIMLTKIKTGTKIGLLVKDKKYFYHTGIILDFLKLLG